MEKEEFNRRFKKFYKSLPKEKRELFDFGYRVMRHDILKLLKIWKNNFKQ